MEQTDSNSLRLRLSVVDEDERNRILKTIWKSFEGSQEHQALDIVLRNLHDRALEAVTDEKIGETARTFHAGIMAAVKHIYGSMDYAFEFDLKRAADARAREAVLQPAEFHEEISY